MIFFFEGGGGEFHKYMMDMSIKSRKKSLLVSSNLYSSFRIMLRDPEVIRVQPKKMFVFYFDGNNYVGLNKENIYFPN